jgi:hypothetical protein
MNRIENPDRPLGVYLVALYLVVGGALETIQKYREWDGPLALNPLANHSIWELAVHPLIYLVLAFLVWKFAAVGRLGALVYGYLVLGTYAISASIYLLYQGEAPMTITPLFVAIGVYHAVALVPVILYLQPARQKRVFHVSLLEIFMSSD